MHTAGRDVVETTFEHGATERGEAVGKDFSVEVVYLVLSDAGEETVDFFGMLLPVLVPPVEYDSVGTKHILMDIGHAETAFVEVFLFAFELKNLRVDENMHVGGVAIGVGLLVIGAHTDGYQADGEVHLRGGETHAVGVVHGLEHIVDKFLEVGIVLRKGLCNLAKGRMSKPYNRQYHILNF
jgi:hypothetical protein